MVKRAEVVAVNDKLDATVARQTLREKMNHHQIQRAEKRSRPGAGGLEAGISALAVYHQAVPPTVNLDNPDPDCDLDYVPHSSRELKVQYALSNSFGFGGTNAALLFKRYQPERA